jgi:hypothetical protein
MCQRCFDGHPIDADVERLGVFRGELPGVSLNLAEPFRKKRRHFVADKRLSQPKPVSECR